MARRLRIVVAAPDWFPDTRGGNARVAAETARALAARGHVVHVLARRVPGSPELEHVDGVLVERTLPARWVLPVTLTDVVAALRRTATLAAGADVVLSHAATVSYGLLAGGLSVPLVSVFHAPVARELRFEAGRLRPGIGRARAWLVASPLERIERAAVEGAAAVLVLSEYSRTLLLSDHPTAAPRVVRVGGGVDTSRFTPGPTRAADVPLLLTVRRLEPRMGLENLLVAVADLDARRPVRLAVVGDGSLRTELRRLAAQLGLGRRARFLGPVGDDRLLAWYRRADFFVLPTVAYEGFGIATAEALACGTPVVGTPVGATPELLAPLDERLLTGAADAVALREGIEAALALRGPALSARCRAYALERLDWSRVILGWEEALTTAVDGSCRLNERGVEPRPSSMSGRSAPA